MKKILTSVVLFAAGLFVANAQQLKTGDSFTYTNADGIEKTYIVTGENLIENPSFDAGTEGWTGGGGGALGNTELNTTGGVDGGAYIRPTQSSGKGDNNSIGTAWDVEVGKTYVFSFFLKNHSNTAAENPAGEGYIKVSMSNTYRDEKLVLQPLPHVDANLAWTQNTWVVTAEYSSLALCARWLGGAKCFDAFILAEVSEVASPVELEQLLYNCDEWINTFGDEAKDAEVFNAIVGEGYDMLDEFDNFTANEINALVAKIKEALLDFRMANASDEYTVDVTDRYIKNTKFDNLGTDWNPVNSAVNNGINFRNFAYFEEQVNPICEINGQPSTEASISQTVHNLPLGYYRFTVQAVMTHSADVDDEESKSGAVIFCNGAELDIKTKEQTAGGAAHDASYPETFTIEGIVSGDSMVVGFKGLPGTNFTYVAIDNVKLEYAGFDAGIYLDGLVNEALDWINDNKDYLVPGIAYELENEAYTASDAMGMEDEEMTAAYIRLDSVFAAAKHSVELVKQLRIDWEEFVNYVEDTQYDGYDAAIAFIDELGEFLELKNENASYAELNAMIAKLEQAIDDYRMSQKASKDTPADYTFLLPNANFEEKGNWVWNLTHNGGGSDLWVGNCRPVMEGGENRRGVNLWGHHIISIDLHQELAGLPNGLYGISAELITQGETADHGDYTTDQHLYVTGINTSVSENLPAPGGWDFYQWSTLQTGYVVVIDGTLTIGAASSKGGDASEGWFQATNFKLQYYGPASDEDLQVAYEATLAEAQALIPNLLKGDAAVLQAKIDAAIALSATSYGEAAALLVDPINVAKTAVLTYNTYKTGAYQTAIDKNAEFGTPDAQDVLSAAIAFAEAITNADTTTTAALAAITEKLNAYIDYTTYLEEVAYMLTDRGAGYAATNIKDVETTIAAQKADLLAEFQNKSNVEDLKAKLQNVVSYMEKSTFMHAKAGDDVTALIVNPTFDSNTSGWIVNKGAGNNDSNTSAHWNGDAANRYMDSYNGTKKALNFRASQVLTDIPNGTYSVKLAARTDSTGAYIFALGEAIASEEVNDSTIMLQVANSANTKWQEIIDFGNVAGGIWQAEEDKWQAGSIYDEALHNVNNGAGFGWSWITIEGIEVTNHEMVIGVTTDSTVTTKPFEGTWFSVDDWSLTLTAVGDNSNWTIESGIENVAATVKETVYYAIDGRRLALPGKGVNIMKTVYSDGRIEVKKVFVK